LLREKIVEGMRRGIVVPEGLIAHGRGECFDYLIGEETRGFALEAMRAAVAALLLAERPVVSVNGNTAVLAGCDAVRLAEEVGGRVEVNLFYRTEERARRIAELLRRECGAGEVLGVEDATARVPGLEHQRGRVSPRGILVADVVLVALEDGDRTEALRRMGKRVIAIDLNPLSRTARAADITIVDNVVRAMPRMVELAREMKRLPRESLVEILEGYDNRRVLAESLEYIARRLTELARDEGLLVRPL